MKKIAFGCLLFLTLLGCRSNSELGDIEANYATYKLGDNRYTVIYVQLEAVPKEEAIRKATEKAAQVAQENGFQYFTIDAQKEVAVVHTAPSPDTDRFHQNLYQEMIVQGDFGKNPYSPGPYPQSGQTFPGMKLTITCYKKNPGKGAIDVCQVLSCSK